MNKNIGVYDMNHDINCRRFDQDGLIAVLFVFFFFKKVLVYWSNEHHDVSLYSSVSFYRGLLLFLYHFFKCCTYTRNVFTASDKWRLSLELVAGLNIWFKSWSASFTVVFWRRPLLQNLELVLGRKLVAKRSISMIESQWPLSNSN